MNLVFETWMDLKGMDDLPLLLTTNIIIETLTTVDWLVFHSQTSSRSSLLMPNPNDSS